MDNLYLVDKFHNFCFDFCIFCEKYKISQDGCLVECFFVYFLNLIKFKLLISRKETKFYTTLHFTNKLFTHIETKFYVYIKLAYFRKKKLQTSNVVYV